MVIHTKLLKEDFEKILESYSIGNYKSHKHIWWAFDNSVYDLSTTKGHYILKIFENTRDSILEFQIKVTDYLHNKGVPVAGLIKNKKGFLFNWKKKKLCIQEFIQGTSGVRTFSDGLLKDIGRKTSQMNFHLLSIKPPKDIEVWSEVNLEKKELKESKYKYLDLQREHTNTGKLINKLDKKKIRTSVVHGDLSETNIISVNDKVAAFIDFDDVHVDYAMYDAVVFIADALIGKKRLNKSRIKIFLQEYQKKMRLNEAEKKMLYYSIKIRIIGVIGHSAKQHRLHVDRQDKIAEWADKYVLRYHTFNKLSLEDFLKLF